ncbi:hypothetical protein J4209_00975 [Candidatus Woesearchaeota archaeon]|nr:hypothetical protein [Candidatus Woesearchaeota archaeon]
MDKLKIKNNDILVGVLIAILIALFLFLLFGLTGIRVAFAILLMTLPFYLILNNFELTILEKILFSFFIGLGIFSTLVYGLALVVNSIRLAIAIAFILLIVIGFGIRHKKKKKKTIVS